MTKKMEENLSFDIDDTVEETRVPIEKVQKKEVVKESRSPKYHNDNDVISCLRNERVIVRHVNKTSGMVTNPKHALYGGMAETATRTFVVPMMSSGAYKNVLTDDEKLFLEEYLGLEYNALSVYKKENNFWDSSSENSVASVTLHKQDSYLDLSNPEDYIRYKILLANKDYIASSLQQLEDNPKATYQFVLIRENDELKNAGAKLSIKKQCYKELGKLDGDFDTLRFIIETLSGRPVSSTVKMEFLETQADDLITVDSKMFLKIITDPMLSTKVLIRKSIEAGLIGKKGDGYYLNDGTPLCELNEDPTLNTAARFLNTPKHQSIKLSLEAKLK